MKFQCKHPKYTADAPINHHMRCLVPLGHNKVLLCVYCVLYLAHARYQFNSTARFAFSLSELYTFDVIDIFRIDRKQYKLLKGSDRHNNIELYYLLAEPFINDPLLAAKIVKWNDMYGSLLRRKEADVLTEDIKSFHPDQYPNLKVQYIELALL
eukprot:341497_1